MSQVLHFPESMYYGPNRSVVRMIATRLPIDSGERVYIQLPYGGSQISTPVEDILDITATDENSFASLLKEPGLVLSNAAQRIRLESIPEEDLNSEETKAEEPQAINEKILSLESELARLRTQIALYTLENEAPPPPPPPPPPPQHSIGEPPPSVPPNGTPIAPPPTFDTSSFVQNIGSVKLRKLDIEKSPGGTPLRPRTQHMSSEPSVDDPAAIIAHALRKKFSHRIFQDSPDKENLDSSDNSFSECNSPRVPPQKLF